MFDLLTREQLSQLHELLFHIGQGIFARLFITDCTGDNPADWYKSRVPTDSDEWAHLRADQQQNTNLMETVYAEMRRRDAQADRERIASPANQSGPYAYIHEDQHMAGE